MVDFLIYKQVAFQILCKATKNRANMVWFVLSIEKDNIWE